MRICLILEGCYPYVFGGVATWVNQYILSKPEHEFVIFTIGAEKKKRGKFVYEIPKNVVEIKEVFLDDIVQDKNIRAKIKYKQDFLVEIKNLILGKKMNWDIIFKEASNPNWNTEHFFHSEEYLNVIQEIAKDELNKNGLVEIFYGMKSMLLPLLQLLSSQIPKADIYHSASTGYAGIIGAIANYKTKKPFILTEHGIYPREREEELLASTWIEENLKKTWINFFYHISEVAYEKATAVTSLFENAKKTQIMIGCSPSKCVVIPNGIHLEKYISMPDKENNGYVDIGAFIRFSSIKDVKTLLYSFYETHSECKQARLHIFGATNDKEYEKQCLDIIETLELKDSIFIYGQINPIEYMPKMDFTVLTSISEGQPLTVLESFAARRPVVCTNVGCCKELISGNNDGLGEAGFCCTPMDVSRIARAMKMLCNSEELRKQYGINGMNRVKNEYTFEKMIKEYFDLYEKELKNWQE